MRSSDVVELGRLGELLDGAPPETEAEARMEGLVRELRSRPAPAPQGLRERVRALDAPAATRRDRFGWRRFAVVATPAAAVFVGAAIALWAVARPADDPRPRAAAPAPTRDVSTTGSGPEFSAQSVDRYAEDVPTKRRTPSVVTELDATAGSRAAKLPVPGADRRARDVDMSIELRVRNADAVSEAANEAMRVTRDLGGYVVASNVGAQGREGRAQLELRVPVGRAEDAVVRLSGLGTITGQQVALRDLQTAVDRRSQRIAALARAIRIDELRLASGTLTPEERLEVEIRLEYQRASLRRVRAERRRLLRDAAIAELSLALHTRDAPAGREDAGRVEGAVRGAADFLAGAGSVALFALIVVAPALILALVAWLALRVRARRVERRLLDRPRPAATPSQSPPV